MERGNVHRKDFEYVGSTITPSVGLYGTPNICPYNWRFLAGVPSGLTVTFPRP